jgi:hypothetical protein
LRYQESLRFLSELGRKRGEGLRLAVGDATRLRPRADLHDNLKCCVAARESGHSLRK